MQNFELFIEPERPQRNKKYGRFLKGHVPHNKGKRWEDYMDMRKAKRLKRIGMMNLNGNMKLGGWNKKPCVRIDSEGNFKVYQSIEEAGKANGVYSTNICRCCKGKSKNAGGYRWFYEDDKKWFEEIKK